METENVTLRMATCLIPGECQRGMIVSEEMVVLKTFSNEIDAGLAQQILGESGVMAFVFKDDVGGMEPQLQLTSGVRLIVSNSNAGRAHRVLKTLTTAASRSHSSTPKNPNGNTLPQSDGSASETWEDEGGKYKEFK